EDVDAAQHLLAGFGGELNLFGCHVRRLLCLEYVRKGRGNAGAYESTPSTSDSFIIIRSLPSILTSVPDHLPNRMRSPAFRSMATCLPSSSRPPGPTETTSPSWG